MTDALAHYARVDRRTGRICIDAQTGRCEWQTNANDAVNSNQGRPPVWCGGDASIALDSGADSSQTTVESANDGKTAAYHIHEYLQVYTSIINYIITLDTLRTISLISVGSVRLPERTERTAVLRSTNVVTRIPHRHRRRGLIRPDVRPEILEPVRVGFGSAHYERRDDP